MSIEDKISQHYHNNKVLALKNVLDYFDKPHNVVVADLMALKKDVFLDNERILFYLTQECDFSFFQYLFDCCLYIDIPEFFVEIVANHTINNLPFKVVQLDIEPTNRVLGNTNFSIPSTICIEPWTAMEVNVQGEVRPCCVFDKPIGYVKDLSLFSAINSDPYIELRKKFLAGEKPAGCKKCWQDETIGKSSKRTRNKSIHPEIYATLDFNNIYDTKLRLLDLKTSHVCNLKCRICSHVSSSTWLAEVKQHPQILDDNAKLPQYTPWISTLDKELMGSIRENIDSIDYVSFAGGEPFMDKNHVKLLDSFIENGLARNVSLHYNTNGTVYPEAFFDKLDKFKKVTISFSIDNIGNRFEYERHGESWQLANSVLNRLATEKTNYHYDIYQTVSVFNVLDIFNVSDYATKLGFGFTYNFLESPEVFAISNMSIAAKDYVSDDLARYKTHEYYTSIINALTKDGTYDADAFWNRINKIDLVRKESFQDVYPEIAKRMYRAN